MSTALMEKPKTAVTPINLEAAEQIGEAMTSAANDIRYLADFLRDADVAGLLELAFEFEKDRAAENAAMTEMIKEVAEAEQATREIKLNSADDQQSLVISGEVMDAGDVAFADWYEAPAPADEMPGRPERSDGYVPPVEQVRAARRRFKLRSRWERFIDGLERFAQRVIGWS